MHLSRRGFGRPKGVALSSDSDSHSRVEKVGQGLSTDRSCQEGGAMIMDRTRMFRSRGYSESSSQSEGKRSDKNANYVSQSIPNARYSIVDERGFSGNELVDSRNLGKISKYHSDVGKVLKQDKDVEEDTKGVKGSGGFGCPTDRRNQNEPQVGSAGHC